jgi:hypothetical protein
MDLRINQIEKMSLRALVKNTLDNNELTQAKNLFEQTGFSSFLQHPEYGKVIGKNALHVLVFDELAILKSYALVEVKNKLLATISFGPLCADENSFSDLILSCCQALLEFGFKIVRFLPPFIQTHNWQKTTEILQKQFSIFSLSTQLNWSTLVLDISPPEEILLKSFSENHRRSIKKANAENLIVERVSNIQQMNSFAEGLCKMYEARNISCNIEMEKERLKNLFSFAIEKGNGLILVIKKSAQILGGIVLIKHNNKIFYLVGFSDPDYKKIPINHLLFYKSFEIARETGCNYFDFGGYGREGFADSQVLNINRFKDGFKGKRVDYPDAIFIAKNSFYRLAYCIYMKWIKRTK